MIELYWAYADYHDMAAFYEEMFRHTVHAVFGSHKVTYDGQEIDFGPKFRWISMVDSIREATGVDFTNLSDADAKAAAQKLGVHEKEKLDQSRGSDRGGLGAEG